MNNFYVIAEEGKEFNEFDIPYFGGTVGQNQVSLAGRINWYKKS